MKQLENEFSLGIELEINEYLEDIKSLLKASKENNIGEVEKEIFTKVEELKNDIDKNVTQCIQAIKEEEKRRKLKEDIRKDIEEGINKREEERKRIQEENEMWEQRDEEEEYAKRQEKEMLEKMDWERRKAEIEEGKRQEKQRKEADKIKSDAERDLAKCHEIFSKAENGYKDLLVDDSFYQDIKEDLIRNYTAEKLEKTLKGRNFAEIYKAFVQKNDTMLKQDKIKLIEKFKTIKERENLLQQQPYRVISSKMQLSVYFDMIESTYNGTLPKAYLEEKQNKLENYSEDNTYIMPKDLLTYFEEILLNKLGYDKQFVKDYDADAKELKIAIEQIRQRNAKSENMEKEEERKVDEIKYKKEPIKKENFQTKKNIFKNIYESAKAKVVSIFTKNKVQRFPIDNKNNNTTFKKEMKKGAPTGKDQVKTVEQYKEKQKYKGTNDRALDNINSIINNNYTIR